MKKILLTVFSFSLLGSGDAQIVKDTFYFTGATEMFTITDCMSSISIDVRGGSGGDANGAQGGNGGRVQGNLSLTSGDVLYINVGGAGANNQGDAAGVFVGSGGVFSYTSGGLSGTGGGGSDVRLNATALTDRIVVAGGGGGAGGTTGTALTGGAGGDLIAGNGINWPGWPDAGGKGGTQVAGGNQGIACCDCPTYTSNGALGIGGEGSGDGAGGGGGGGGYYGGGGACFSGGGGGSSFADAAVVSSVVHTQGFQDGNGMIIITYTVGSETTSSISLASCDSLISPSGLYVWDESGIYMDTIVNALGCDSIMTIDVTIDTLVKTVTSLTFSQLSADQVGASYQWVNCNNSFAAIPGATSQVFNASSNGSYACVVTIGSCSDTTECTAVTGLGIDENTQFSGIEIYPNPFNDKFTVSLTEVIPNGTIAVIDLTGKVILTKSIQNSTVEIDLTDAANGMYFVKFEGDNTERIIKVTKE